MLKWKKLAALLLAGVLTFSFTACQSPPQEQWEARVSTGAVAPQRLHRNIMGNPSLCAFHKIIGGRRQNVKVFRKTP